MDARQLIATVLSVGCVFYIAWFLVVISGCMYDLAASGNLLMKKMTWEAAISYFQASFDFYIKILICKITSAKHSETNQLDMY